MSVTTQPLAVRLLHDPRIVLTLLSLTIFTTITYELLPVGLLTQMAAALGTTEQGAGLLVGAYSVSVMVASIPLSAVTARFDARITLAVLLGILAISAGILGAAPALVVGLIARLMGGLAHAVIWTSVFRLAVAIVPDNRQGRAATALSAGNAVALTVGVPLATALGAVATWRLPFAILSAAFVALAAIAAVTLPREIAPADASMSAGSVLRAATRPSLLRVGVTIAALTTAHFATYTYLVPLLAGSHIDGTSVSWVLTGYGFAGLVGLVAVARVSDRRPAAALGVTLAIMAASLLTVWLFIPHAGGAAIGILVWGIGAGAFPVLFQVLALRAAGPYTAAAPSAVNSTFNIGITAGATIGGQIVAIAGATPLPIITAALFTVVMFLVFSPRWLPRSVRRAD